MRRKVKRLLGVSALSLFLSLGLAGCSGQQQAEEGVEVSEQGENQQGAENTEGNAEGNAEANADSQGGNGSEEANADAQGAATEGAETAEAPANGSENDLQEIIQEMNSQPTGDTAQAAPAPEAAPPAGNQTAMATPTPAEAPAPAAAPAPQTQAAPAAPSSGMAIPFQPGGSPAATGLPEIGSKMAYVVERGDTLGKISQKIYGSTGRWKELASLSGLSNPSRIFPGDLVYYTLDETAVKFAQAYESVQRSEVQVSKGQTLAKIAKSIYGSSKAWRSIWRQNDHIDNPDVIPPGTTIYYIPSGAASASNYKHQTVIAKTKSNQKTKIDASKFNQSKTQQITKNSTQKINVATSHISLDQFDSLTSINTMSSVANI